jgi:hypothetical protein
MNGCYPRTLSGVRKKLFFLTATVLTVFAIAMWSRSTLPERSCFVPVKWTVADTPAIEVSVDGQKCLLQLCTAEKFFLTLDEAGLGLIADKAKKGLSQWYDVKGVGHESAVYKTQNFLIEHLVFSNIEAIFTPEKDEKATSILWSSPNCNADLFPKTCGSIGRPLLLKTNLYLDLGHDIIILASSKEALKRHGIFVDTMKKFALEPEERGVIVKVDTEVGPLRLAINTGSTISIVRSSSLQPWSNNTGAMWKDYRGFSYFRTDLSIGGSKIGRQDICLTEVTEGISWLDGWLGADFLCNHRVYIDFPNKIVYIS